MNKNHQGQNGRIEDKKKMNKRKYYFTLTLVVSILVGIILSFSLLPTPINLDWFFLVMALSFSLVWAIYSLILLGYVFLVKVVLDHLKKLRESGASPQLSFSRKVIERFNELHLLLVEFGEGYGKKGSSFTEIIGFSLQNWFLKMIAILANSHKRTEASIFDVEMAFVDLLEFLDSNFEYVERKVQGSLDYEDRDQPTGTDLEMLEWLKQKGALSYRASKISIQTYQEKISKKFEVSPDGARRRYQKHVWKGWIKGKQKGSYGSRVWVTIRLDGDEGEQGEQGDRVIAEYQRIISHHTKEKAILLLTAKEIPLLPWLRSKEDEVHPVTLYHPDGSRTGSQEPPILDADIKIPPETSREFFLKGS